MKRNSKQFLALFLSASLALSPVTLYAQDDNGVQSLAENYSNSSEIEKQSTEAAETVQTPSAGNQVGSTTQTAGENTGTAGGSGTNGSGAQAGDIQTGAEQNGSQTESSKTDGSTSATDGKEDGSAGNAENGTTDKTDATGNGTTDKTDVTANGLNVETKTPEIQAQSLEINNEKYDDGSYDLELESTYKMFVIKGAKASVSGNKLMVSFYTESNTYDRIYFGVQADTDKSTFIQGTKRTDADGYEFAFELPVSKMGQTVPFVPGKTDGTWYVSSKGTEYYMTIPTALKEPEVTYDEGNYDIGLSSSFSMFKVTDPTAVVNGKKITVSFHTQSTNYDRFYFGLQDDVDKSTYVQGTLMADGSGYEFTFDLPMSKMGQTVPFVPGKPDGTWYKSSKGTEYYLTIPEITKKETPPEQPDPSDPATPSTETPGDGSYGTTVESSSSMFNIVDCVLTSKDGKMSAVITLSGTGYDYLYVGTGSEAAADSKSNWIAYKANSAGQFTYTVPVSALDTPIDIAAHSIAKNSWYDRKLTFSSKDLKQFIDEGTYSMDVTSSAAMFRVVNCVLTSKNHEMTAVLTLSGTGYGKLFVGTAEEAETADASKYIPFVVDKDGKYTYTVPVSMLDKGLNVAAYSTKNEKWYDRELTFDSATLKKLSDGNSGGNSGTGGNSGSGSSGNTGNNGNTNTGNNGNTTDNKPEEESKYETDLSGATGKVNSSTTLKDGVYKPDGFSWSGGTGRVGITCNKITITNGQAYATIVFGSSSYAYVKANGNKYFGSVSGDTTSFVIPIALNQNNTIIGMTTKMSAAHEITYSIYVYLAAAANGTNAAGSDITNNNKLDEEAPQIMGLEYQSETKLEYAQYFKLFHYDQGITLLEVDMTKDTALESEATEKTEESENADATEQTTAAEDTTEGTTEDTAKTESLTDAATDTDTADTAASTDLLENGSSTTAVSDEEGTSTAMTSKDAAAELYKGNIVKYLIVPEGIEVPAGLDKNMIIVQLPADKSYVDSENVMNLLSEVNQEDQVAVSPILNAEATKDEAEDATGDEADDTTKDTTENTAEIDYKELVKEKCNLAVLSADYLPQEAQEKAADAMTVKEQTDMLQGMTDHFAMLGIPAIIDRSMDETTKEARAEWSKVYGILFGCEKEMENLSSDTINGILVEK